MKHTPSPWKIDRTGKYYKPCIRRNGVVVALLPDSTDNDHLIEAAPELLKTLEDACEWMSSELKEIGGCDHAVGICCCADWEKLYSFRAIINNAKRKSIVSAAPSPR